MTCATCHKPLCDCTDAAWKGNVSVTRCTFAFAPAAETLHGRDQRADSLGAAASSSFHESAGTR